jgi:hypothetical protein
MQAKIRFRTTVGETTVGETTVGETGMGQPTDGTAASKACRAIFGAKSLGRCDVTCNGSHGGHLPNREIEPPPIFSEITTLSTLRVGSRFPLKATLGDCYYQISHHLQISGSLRTIAERAADRLRRSENMQHNRRVVRAAEDSMADFKPDTPRTTKPKSSHDRQRQVYHSTANERAAIVHSNHHRPAVADVCYANHCSKRESSVCGGKCARCDAFATRSPRAALARIS